MKKYPYLKFLLFTFSTLIVTACFNITVNNYGKDQKDNTTVEQAQEILEYEVAAQEEEDYETSEPTKITSEKKDIITIGVVTWGGYAAGQYWNKGFKANTESQFYKDYGFKVEFKLLDDFDACRDAFKYGKVDLLWCTVDAFPTEVEGLKQYEPQIVFIADWSRGGDAIIVNKSIQNYADLKGKTIAVAPMTPSHTFLIWALEQANLTSKDVTIMEVPSAINAADAFKGGNVDAAVVWSPDDMDCIKKVSGSKILVNTKEAKYLIADGFIAKKSFIESNKKELQQLYEGWMKGAAAINNSEKVKKEAAKILAEGLQQPEDFCFDIINNVRLTNHGDNLNLFGLNKDYDGVTGEYLYSKMAKMFADLGYAPKIADSWSMVANTDLISNANLKAIDEQAAEK
jgi:NitT/TauT family transport system substrate-binding protein